MLFINVLCMAYLALFAWANNWWYDLEDYEDEDDEECEEPLHYGSTSSGRRRREYGSRTRQVGHNSSRTLQSVNDSPLRTGKTRNDYHFYDIFPESKLVQTNADTKVINLLHMLFLLLSFFFHNC